MATGGMYRLLARLWLSEVDLALLVELFAAPLKQPFVQSGGVLPDAADSDTVEELAVEFCELFVGPKNHLPPIQSIWQTGQFQSQSETSMREFIDLLDLDQASLPSGTMLDHLGLQLDIMGHLATLSADAVDDPQNEGQVRAVGQEFFARHLSWPDRLFNEAEKRASSGFYRSVIAMTRQFLATEQRYWHQSATE